MKWRDTNHAPGKETVHKRVSPFSSRALRSGGYSVLVSLIMVAAIIAVNLFVGQIPTTYTKLDTTSEQLFTLSAQTTGLVGGLGSDVTLYLVAQSGQEDSRIQELLARYKALSSHITVSTVDPVTSPKFTAQYTTDEVASNSIIVVSGDRNRVVGYDEIYVADYSNYSYDNPSVDYNFDGENALTSAIDRVTSADLPVVYTLQGHGETEISTTLKDKVTDDNITLKTLSLLTMEALPEDMDCLIVYAPTSDLSQGEADRIKGYLENGGRMLLITSGGGEKMPVLASLMEGYGVRSVDGMVLEGDMNNCYQYVHYLLPNIMAHDITTPIRDKKLPILMPLAQGIVKLDSYRSTLTISDLLTTSDKAFSKVNLDKASTAQKETGDIDGPFDIGVAISETVNGKTAKVVWFGSSQLLDEGINQQYSNVANYDLFLNSLGWMCERTTNISIRAKSLTAIEALMIPSGTAGTIGLSITVLLPLLVIGIGILVFVMRRKR